VGPGVLSGLHIRLADNPRTCSDVLQFYCYVREGKFSLSLALFSSLFGGIA
jgi:hypothetical protein